MKKVARKLSSSVYPICLGLAAICALVVGSPRTVTATPVIVTTQGRLTGISTAGEDLYLGIPYAEPPVGELRWRPPHSPAHFKGVFKATQFGNPCVQPNGTGGTIGTQNCLSLNVYVPNVALQWVRQNIGAFGGTGCSIRQRAVQPCAGHLGVEP